MIRYRNGLVVGKFAPLHLGHEHVIRTALAACDHVVVLSYSRPEFPGCEPARRAQWLAARFPETTRIVLDHTASPLPENSDTDDVHRAFCSTVLHRHIAQPIDAVFTSESYGPGFAADLALRQGHPVAHVPVDISRTIVPVSGTELRADIHGLRHFLAPDVYASFVQRIGILGGESTGKSTLAHTLAREFATTHVAEFGRDLWEQRNGQLVFDDMLAIAREQIRREEAALRSPTTCRFVFCDTTPLTTLFYSCNLFGQADPELEILSKRTYSHLFLCADDFPFHQDGTRRTADFRSEGQAWYRAQLRHLPYTLLQGTMAERIAQVRLATGASQMHGFD